MSNVIIYTAADGGLVEVSPAPGFTDEYVRANDVPTGISSFITDRCNLPGDDLFRNAWKENGSTVFEDLEGSRAIALNYLKEGAQRALRDSTEETLLGNSPEVTTAAVAAAYQSCKADLEATSSVSEIRTCLSNFMHTYAAPIAAAYSIPQ
tara:strand:+ start:1653 stop:2105 length:453 start_codon:yes stop_codon:yes gene_type:complete